MLRLFGPFMALHMMGGHRLAHVPTCHALASGIAGARGAIIARLSEDAEVGQPLPVPRTGREVRAT
jgi:hypothetical protein